MRALAPTGTNRDVALNVARRIAAQWTDHPVNGDVDEILRVVCEVMSQDPLEVAGDRRFAHLVATRFLWWACLRRYTGWTWERIADHVDRNHASVMRGVSLVPNSLIESVGPLLTTWHESAAA